MADQSTLVVPYTDGHRITFTYGLLSYRDDDDKPVGSIVSGGSSIVLRLGEHSATISLPELFKVWVATFDPAEAAKIEEALHAGS